jgi:hypothetical protein
VKLDKIKKLCGFSLDLSIVVILVNAQYRDSISYAYTFIVLYWVLNKIFCTLYGVKKKMSNVE